MNETKVLDTPSSRFFPSTSGFLINRGFTCHTIPENNSVIEVKYKDLWYLLDSYVIEFDNKLRYTIINKTLVINSKRNLVIRFRFNDYPMLQPVSESKVTLLEKRLIALSELGITIQHSGGHRWILSMETDTFDFNTECEKQHNYPCKVYGGINEALYQVDTILKNTDRKSLLDVYNSLVLQYDSEREDYIITCDKDLD